jgi:hypothetical protein
VIREQGTDPPGPLPHHHSLAHLFAYGLRSFERKSWRKGAL